MERDNRDEDIMMRGTKQEMPGFAGIPFSATPAGEETGTVESGF